MVTIPTNPDITEIRRTAEFLEDMFALILEVAAKEFESLPGERGSFRGRLWSEVISKRDYNDLEKYPLISDVRSYAYAYGNKSAKLEKIHLTARKPDQDLTDFLQQVVMHRHSYDYTGHVYSLHERNLRSMFDAFASSEQIDQFFTLQKKLLDDLNQDLLAAPSYEVKGVRHYIASSLEAIVQRYNLSNANNRITDYMARKKDFFNQPSSFANDSDYVSEFGKNGQHKVKAIENDIRSIAAEPLPAIRKIAKTHDVPEESVLAFIIHRPDRWQDIPALAGLLALPEIAFKFRDETWVERPGDYGISVRSALYDAGIDTKTPTIAAKLAKIAIGDAQYQENMEAIDARRTGQKPRVPVVPANPGKIKTANNIAEGVSEIFAEETVSPRKKKHTHGGRAGLGPKKPGPDREP